MHTPMCACYVRIQTVSCPFFHASHCSFIEQRFIHSIDRCVGSLSQAHPPTHACTHSRGTRTQPRMHRCGRAMDAACVAECGVCSSAVQSEITAAGTDKHC
eukprot:GHVU01114003.1.p2 GENE.GHVU01114003.1~~GHVU01114003.1.p2  ORF type:complete len:101 (-),score=2.28 GHVU01114003.1:347-649(-)